MWQDFLARVPYLVIGAIVIVCFIAAAHLLRYAGRRAALRAHLNQPLAVLSGRLLYAATWQVC
ncbi:MAG: hypothetical protein SFV54_15150 [Bryobacteraceae bacterium]|nr:hypothetical protein [Bryobacteraceae bacterium]